MENRPGLRTVVLVALVLVVAGFVAVKLISWLFSIALYLIVGALVVGGAVYLYGRAKRSLTGGRRGIGR